MGKRTPDVSGDPGDTPRTEADATPHYTDDSFFDLAQPREGRAVIMTIGALLVFFVIWAGATKLDEVTRAEGRVIPSLSTQSVMSSQPGTVTEMLVQVGEQVEAGEVLVRLDATENNASLGELEARRRALRAQQERLRMEFDGGEPEDFVCPEDIQSVDPAVCATERNLFEARHNSLRDRGRIAYQRLTQRQRQLAEARANVRTYSEGLSLARQQLELVRPMVENSVLPRTDLLNAERAVSEQRGLLSSAREAVEGASAAVLEAEAENEAVTSTFREEVIMALTEVEGEISVIDQTLRGAASRVSGTEIRSPVSGTINAIAVRTIGAYVAPGQEILSVVPRDDNLLVEARLSPSDIAFIRNDQPANVKVTAYDFTIYGGLDAHVSYVSSDSVYNAERDETYFIVHLQADRAFLETAGQSFPISPGMITQVEIMTGRKSILDYLLKPITRAWGEALRER